MATADDIISGRLSSRPSLAAAMTTLVDAGKIRLIDTDPRDLPAAEITLMALCPSTVSVGAKQGRCGCGAFVWMSPRTQEMAAAHAGKMILVCEACMIVVASKISTPGKGLPGGTSPAGDGGGAAR